MTRARTRTMIAWGLSLGLGLGLGCRGDGGEEGSRDRPAATAVETPAAPAERPRLEPPLPGAVRPPPDFNRPPAVPPRYRIELDRGGKQVTYTVQPDGGLRRVDGRSTAPE